MTTHHDQIPLPALEELGRRLERAAVQAQPAKRRQRRVAIWAVGLTMLVGTPAMAITIFAGEKSVQEAQPEVAAAVDRHDPAATGRELERLGYKVRWQLITDRTDRTGPNDPPTIGRDVAAPPPGTKILWVGNANAAQGTSNAETRSLLIEVSPPDSDILKTHPIRKSR